MKFQKYPNIFEMIYRIKQLKSSDEDLTIRGWVCKIKTFSKHSFTVVRDGPLNNDKIQIYISSSLLPDSLTIESYIQVVGTVKNLPEGKYSYQPFELIASKIEVISLALEDFSSRCPDDAGTDVQLDQRHLYIRTDKFAVIIKLRAIFLKSIRRYFEVSECTEITPPSFVGNQCEGGATLFKLDHVGQPAYLTQSSQFYLEMAVPAVGDCYCIAPSFRAEHSHTRRHLTEFTHVEAEWRNIQTMEDHVRMLRQMLYFILCEFYEAAEELLKQIGRLSEVEKYREMIREGIIMDHREAIEYCQVNKIQKDDGTDFGYQDDIPEAQERKMIDTIGKVVFLTRFPVGFKSFYMKRCSDDPNYVEGCDVEVPGVGEIIGSGIRVPDPDELIKRLKDQGLKEEEYREYIDLRRYGHGQTSGMGLGLDRMLTWLLGAYSIREVVTFPRYPGRLFP